MLRLQLVFLLFGAALGAFYPFVAVILAARGFSPAEIGIVTAAASVAFTVAVPAWGHLADVVVGRTGALRLAAFGCALALVGFGLTWPPAVLGALYVGFMVFESAIGPLADALAVNALSDPARHYGRIRLLSSVAFAAVSVAAGVLYDSTGYWPASLLCAGLVLAIVPLSVGLPDRPRLQVRPSVSDAGRVGRGVVRPRGGSLRQAATVAPSILGVAVAISLAFGGVIAGFTYLGLRIVDLGGQASDVALSAAIAAFAEIPAMAAAGAIAARFGLRVLFGGAALLYALCLGSWVVVADVGLILASRSLTGLAFAGLWIGSVLAMRALLPDELQGTGQGVFQVAAFGIGALVANGAGGVVYGTLGHGVLFALAGASAVAGAAVAWRVLPGPRPRVRAEVGAGRP